MTHSSEWLRREPFIIGSLIVASSAFFVLTLTVSNAFRREKADLTQAFERAGSAALASARPDAAVEDFRTALLYEPDDDDLRFKLAQALAMAGQDKEAFSQFMSLWESEPGNGDLNLELARIAVHLKQPTVALRFFNGAVYGVWPEAADQHRHQARLELIKFLLKQRSFAQADAELVALATELPSGSPERVEVGSLFRDAQDPAQALKQFQSVLSSDDKNRDALLGAGRSAFELGDYAAAARCLDQAAALAPMDPHDEDLLRTSQLVVESDPFRQGLSLHERATRAWAAFEIAGERLKTCPSLSTSIASDSSTDATVPPSPFQADYAKWKGLESSESVRKLIHDPDLIEPVMALVFQIESDTEKDCGPPTANDEALRLIGHSRSGGAR